MKTDNKARNIIAILFTTLILVFGMTVLVYAEDIESETEAASADSFVVETMSDEEAEAYVVIAEDEVDVQEIVVEETEEIVPDEVDPEPVVNNIEEDPAPAEDIVVVASNEKIAVQDVAEDVKPENIPEDVNAAEDDTVQVNNEVTPEVVKEGSDDTSAAEKTEEVIPADKNKNDIEEDKEEPETPAVENEETVPFAVIEPAKVVNISDLGKETAYTVNDDGTVVISDFLINFDEDAVGSESFVMMVNGKEYSLTVYSDGSYAGELPEGFSIDGGSIVISGIVADMDIQILNHTAISGISYEPEFEAPSPSVVTLINGEEVNAYFADEEGNIAIDGLFMEFDEDADAAESFVMLVNGEEYSFTLASDGSYEGELPDGFFIEDGILFINGYEGDMEIFIVEHTAISAIYEEPVFEEPEFASLAPSFDDANLADPAVLADFSEPVFEEADSEAPVATPVAETVAVAEPTADPVAVAYELPAVAETLPVEENAEPAETDSDEVIVVSEDDAEPVDMGVIRPEDFGAVAQARVLGASSVPFSPEYFAVIAAAIAVFCSLLVIKKKKSKI